MDKYTQQALIKAIARLSYDDEATKADVDAVTPMKLYKPDGLFTMAKLVDSWNWAPGELDELLK